MIIPLALLAGAYLIGSIPFGFLIARSRGIDIREHGSGNVGATNVLRVLGRRAGITCFALDVAKGLVPTLAAGAVLGGLTPAGALALDQPAMWTHIGVAVLTIVGHMYSVWLGLQGGKGVATGLGAMLGIWPLGTFGALLALGVWITAAKITRYVSIASVAAAVTLPIGAAATALLTGAASGNTNESPASALARAWPYLLSMAALAALVIYKHRGNLSRLRRGIEPRIGERPEAASTAPDVSDA